MYKGSKKYIGLPRQAKDIVARLNSGPHAKAAYIMANNYQSWCIEHLQYRRQDLAKILSSLGEQLPGQPCRCRGAKMVRPTLGLQAML